MPPEVPEIHNRGMRDPWMIDELAHAGPEHLDPAFVAGFEYKSGYGRQGGPDPDNDLAEFHRYGQTGTLVDLGAGTGRLALAAAPHFRRVIAVDVSPAMVEFMRGRTMEAGLSNVECVHAGFLSYEHDGAPADVVHTRNALHQLPDFWKALALQRISGMLRPGGVLRIHDLIYDFHPSEAGEVFGRWLERAVTDPEEGYTAQDLAEHIRTEHSALRWLFEPMLEAAGFTIDTAEFYGQVFGAYTCVKR